MGVFLIHLAVQFQAISGTPFSPAVNLVPWHHCWITAMGVRSTRVRTIVCTTWISPLRGLNPQSTRGPIAKHHCYSCSYSTAGTDVPIQTCLGTKPYFSKCVNILRHSADNNPQSQTWIFGQQAMCIPIVQCPCPPTSGLGLHYWATITGQNCWVTSRTPSCPEVPGVGVADVVGVHLELPVALRYLV